MKDSPQAAPALFAAAWNAPPLQYLECFCVDGRRVFFNRSSERHRRQVVAHDTASGQALWTYPVTANLVAAHAGRVLIEVHDDGLHVVDAESAQPLLTLGGRLRPSAPGSFACGAGDHVVLGGEHMHHARPMVRCFDLRSGARKWTYWPEGRIVAIAVAGSRVVVTLADASLRVLETSTGRLAWSRAPRERPALGVTTVVDGERLLCAAERAAYALEDGSLLWRMREPHPWTTESVGPGVLYVFEAPYTAMKAIDTATGCPVMSADVEITVPPRLRALAPGRILHVAAEHILTRPFGSYEGPRLGGGNTMGIACIDRTSGELVWGERVPGTFEGLLPLGNNGFLYKSSEGFHAFARVPRPL